MFARRLSWMIVTLALLLLPAFTIGCGADDNDVAKTHSMYTVGPGALEGFTYIASGS
ncbi:MAG: hypothetical protein OZSIB_3088 [Candidatus Ozemobacter sibiricus]|jgi:hypothetical protein|uniref:Uncharacterized protein n=1 Tax=Candidatus Ozemobacter sibiricus TaxID=2268124 RepID=A0A367ZHE8_9BACT|nr:MAG: hypothetical protein OZSIB_3088 [Candidatus Ozemobacter sibiricus]